MKAPSHLAPAHLAPAERTIWSSLAATYGVDDIAGTTLLTAACEALQRARRCRETIEADGLLVAGKAHPLLTHLRSAEQAFLAAIRELGLDLEPGGMVGHPVTGSAVRRVK